MVKQLQERYDKVPNKYLVDGGFAKQEDIEQLDPDPDDETSSGTVVYASVQKPKKSTRTSRARETHRRSRPARADGDRRSQADL